MSGSPKSTSVPIEVYRAAKNGLIYGYKIRFAHTLALQLLSLGRGQKRQSRLIRKLWKCVRLGLEHGKVLAVYAIIYKGLLRILGGNPKAKDQPRRLATLFLSGFIGGVLVYGGLINKGLSRGRSAREIITGSKHRKHTEFLNERILTQISLNTLSRTIMAGAKNLIERKMKNAAGLDISTTNNLENKATLLAIGLIWGTVMMMYDSEQNVLLQKSMKLSMDYIYGERLRSFMEAFWM